jgi:hypothetical protein
VNTTVYMPSYVEWLTCLEMEQHVEALRRNKVTATDPATDGQGKRQLGKDLRPSASRQ